MTYKDYDKLVKKNEYDKERAEAFAEAMTEFNELNKRLKYLTELINENRELTPFMWTTLQGECKPLHKIEDDHLRNILGHILNRGGRISAEIKAEAMSRGIEVPDWETVSARRLLAAREGEIIEGMDAPDWDD